MTINFSSMKKISEGKTKIIYENPEDTKTVYMVFKDDITAGDGVKHDIITGKAFQNRVFKSWTNTKKPKS